MSEYERRIEQLDKIVDIAEKILNFNERYQEGQGLKILTPDQMLSGLPITQLQAVNNSEKRKNEVRQPFYSLYCSIVQKIIQNNL